GFIVGGPVGDFELLLCHGTVCVVGKMRDLILQLSKSSIYSTKPLNTSRNRSMRKQSISPQVTKAQIYRSVASSTAIETGVSVQKIEQQLKKNQAQAKAVGLAR
ncbi:hypothetical protein, partial [Enterobacter kobei]